MYLKNPSGQITLWCNGCSDEEPCKCKRDESSTGSSKWQKKEEVGSVFQELKEKHGTKYDTPRLHLWAQMVASNLRDDFDTPPTIPAFVSTPHKPRPSSPSFSTAISGAAAAFAKALGENS